MNKLLKFIIFSAMLVNLGSLPAMDDADHDIFQNPFSLGSAEDPFQPTALESTDNWDCLGLGMSAAETISAPEPEPDTTTRTVRAIQDQQEPPAFPYDNSWFNFAAAASSEPTTSTAAPESDTVVDIACETDADEIPALDDAPLFDPLYMSMATAQATLSSEKPARKTRRRISSAASASSSSASSASPTDVSASSSTGASCSLADDDLSQYCKPLPTHCPWPDCTEHDTYFSPPYEEISGLTKLRLHIRNVHKPKHESDGFRCPHTGCKKLFDSNGRLDEHLISAHNRTAAFQCNICAEKKTFNTKSICRKHMLLHKQIGKYSCHGAANFSMYSGWCKHIRKCPKLETRIGEKRYFLCPCGDACTKEEALRHVKLCARARDGMVYIKQKKIIFGPHKIYMAKDGVSTHDECMDRLGLERTAAESETAPSASSSSASASSSTDTPASELDAKSDIYFDSDGVPMFNIAPDDQTPTGSSISIDSLTM